jgi:hypothetical protein
VRTLDRQRSQLDALDTARRSAVARLTLRASDAHDQAVAAAATRDLADEHATRLDRLLRQCHAVFALDPGVRAARAAVCTAIALDQAALRANPQRPAIGKGNDDADRLLGRERRQWHIGQTASADVAPFTSARQAEAGLRRFADEPIGARLLVMRGGALYVMDLDNSEVVRLMQNDVQQAAMLGDWVVVTDSDGVWSYDLPDMAHRRRIEPSTSPLVASPDTNTVWIATADGYVELERDGKRASAVFAPGREWLVAATSRYLVTVPQESVGDPQPLPERLTLWDRATRRLVRRIDDARLADARGDYVVWTDSHNALHGSDSRFAFNTMGGDVTAARISPDGRRVAAAVDEEGRSTLHVCCDSTELVTVLSIEHAFDLRFTPDGRWLFAASPDGRIAYASGDDFHNRPLRLNPNPYALIAAL